MKKNHFLALMLGFIGIQSVCAQAPASFNYQAVPRRQDSLLYAAGQTLRFRFQVREDFSGGNVVFAETSSLTVNRQGAVNTAIGTGTPVNGVSHDLAILDWGGHNYFLSVAIDLNNNNSFEANENFGASQLLSVPYAMYAAQSGSGEQTLSISGNTLSISNGNSVDLPVDLYQAGNGINIFGQTIYAYDESPTNEIQSLSISGNQLTISEGNTITLPSGGGGGSFSLPYTGSANSANTLFSITNNGTGTAIHGRTNGGGTAVFGEDLSGGLAGVQGYSTGSYGVLGVSVSNAGVIGQSNSGTGVYAQANSANAIGLEAINNFGGKAIDVTGWAQFNNGLFVGETESITDGGIFQFACDGTLRPASNNFDDIGSSTKRWYTVYATNGTINTSDARQKRDVKPLTYGIDELMQLQPVSYQWIDGRPGEGRYMGFLAQDLQKVIPEVVRDKEWMYDKADRSSGHWRPAATLGVAYSEIIPVAVAAIQEQQKQIEMLRAELDALRKQVETLKKQ